jgi:WD40-like Beta Propeller Repeat
MTSRTNFDVDLRELLNELGGGRSPEYLSEMTTAARHGRQRPRWAVLEWWAPGVTGWPGVVLARRREVLLVLALLVLVIGAAIAAGAFNRPRPTPLLPVVVAGTAHGAWLAFPQSANPRPFTGGETLRISPDGQWVLSIDRAGGMDYALHALRLDGTADLELAKFPRAALGDGPHDAFWTPDGRGVVGIADRTLFHLAFAAGAQREDVDLDRQMPRFDVRALSPDGTTLLAMSDSADLSDVYLIDARSGTVDGPLVVAGSPLRVDGGLDQHWAWSADGHTLMMVVADGSLATVDVATGKVTERGGAQSATAVWGWSADGRLFGVDHTVRSASGEPVATVPGAAPGQAGRCDSLPVWSPTDASIAAVADGDLVVMSADGRQLERLAERVCTSGVEVRWSPDGTRLAYIVRRFGAAEGPWEAWVVDRDGSPPVRIAAGGTVGGWNPVLFEWGAETR